MSSSELSSIEWINGLPPTASVAVGVRDRAYEIAKRAFDLIFAAVLLVLVSPLLILAMLAVKLTSPGPIFFRQLRAGRDARPFRMYKLRTMVATAEDDKELFRKFNELPTGPCFKIKNDPRVTWVGRYLRRASIDELPQLWNVLRGEMSVVGPRPLPLDEVRLDTPEQVLRLTVKPGLTCLWQISGRTEIPYEEWLALDVWWIRNRTFWLDLQIVLKTIPAILTGHGAF